jgi:hypothetical protein
MNEESSGKRSRRQVVAASTKKGVKFRIIAGFSILGTAQGASAPFLLEALLVVVLATS